MANKERIPLYAFVGPEGSGKTTQAKALAVNFGLLYFSTGDQIREAALNDKTEFGDACRAMFEKSVYLAPWRILKMLGERFKEDDAARGVVLDGGFRTLKETAGFPEMLARLKETTGRDFSVTVIFLRAPLWKGMDRALSRRGRTDSNIASLLNRLEEFSTDLGKRMCFIKANYPFIMVLDGGRCEERIGQEILEKL